MKQTSNTTELLCFRKGKSSKSTPWIVASVMSFTGMVSSSFIPETVNHQLPVKLQITH